MASLSTKEVGLRMSEVGTLDLFAPVMQDTPQKETMVSTKKAVLQQTAKEVVSDTIDPSKPVKVLQAKESEPRSSRRKGPEKSDDAFKTISEVATIINVPQHVLRFWETKFSQIKPMKRGGGRRYYRPKDVEIIKRIQYLLHNEGYTIKGVQKYIRKVSLAEFLGEAVVVPTQTPVVTKVPKVAVEKPVTQETASLNEPLAVILEGLKAIRAELNA